LNADLHIHSKDCSDGKWGIKEILNHAHSNYIEVISITDHDSISCQELASNYAKELNIRYITGVEISIRYKLTLNGIKLEGPLDILGYGFDITNLHLRETLELLSSHRRERIKKIVANLNRRLKEEGYLPISQREIDEMETQVGASIGRPHLADLLVKTGRVRDRKEAFDRYLNGMNIPKYPLSLEKVSTLIRAAGGKVILAHPNDPNGTSLKKFFEDLKDQFSHIEIYMLPFLDGIECWHTRHDNRSSDSYSKFAMEHGLLRTGGSDCHQNPVRIGAVKIPGEALEEFLASLGGANGD